ncbi:hypothetical protein B0T16DRAFT_421144 [Cercophora newfieldiana]|uniref:Zn(2)-C6 fungal-type domain-containing protein n=1 Tax=Cercophora newfieldiana TaxID=92897 RepID=A0AA39XXP3_9PEZI|nr:hypothetical protein B0T16DRAFT_421144 [Cercophora newfieldiana]
MPGVPSSRGCTACRQQKKKCDQLTPLCSRCARLGIPCIGSGERRYKFMDAPIRTSSKTGTRTESPPAAKSKMQLATPVPSNRTALDASHFISALRVTDVRFDLRIYGPFFVELPRRLGKNRALDASVRALAASYPWVHTRQYTPDMYKAYGEALACLRVSLGDPATAGSVETMCAVYLIMICQGWIGRGGDFFPNHGEAIAHLLNTAAAARNWQDEFAAEVTNTLLVIVIIESFANHKINLDPSLWAPSGSPVIARPNRPPANHAPGIECLRIPSLAAIADYTRNPQGNLPAIISAHAVLQCDLANMKALLSEVQDARHIHARRQTSYGTLLLLGLMANWALRVFGIGNPHALELEKAMLIDEIIDVAQGALQYRPLAASAMPRFIMAARMMADNKARLVRLEELLTLYRSDFPTSD